MQYFTGSKEHNVALRQRAIRMGFKLSEYGLFRADDDTRVAGATEEEVYRALGLDWIRRSCAKTRAKSNWPKRRLPKLIDRRHSRRSAHAHHRDRRPGDAREKWPKPPASWIQIHRDYRSSKAIAMAFGLDETRVVEFAYGPEAQRGRPPGIHIFSGLECDIMKDGAMDIEWDALAELDS